MLGVPPPAVNGRFQVVGFFRLQTREEGDFRAGVDVYKFHLLPNSCAGTVPVRRIRIDSAPAHLVPLEVQEGLNPGSLRPRSGGALSRCSIPVACSALLRYDESCPARRGPMVATGGVLALSYREPVTRASVSRGERMLLPAVDRVGKVEVGEVRGFADVRWCARLPGRSGSLWEIRMWR
jgi:hypothetical protein